MKKIVFINVELKSRKDEIIHVQTSFLHDNKDIINSLHRFEKACQDASQVLETMRPKLHDDCTAKTCCQCYDHHITCKVLTEHAAFPYYYYSKSDEFDDWITYYRRSEVEDDYVLLELPLATKLKIRVAQYVFIKQLFYLKLYALLNYFYNAADDRLQKKIEEKFK